MALQSVFILTGEPSADALGGEIMGALGEGVKVFGMGGKAMQTAGLDAIARQQRLTIIGLGGVVRAWFDLHALADELISAILTRRPDVILTIDSKAFSLRFARRLKKAMAKAGWHAPIVHLVAPTVWSWGGWRAKHFAEVMDEVLCLFPFEPAYFTRHGGRARYVGHPLLARDMPSKTAARRALGLDAEAEVVALMPGSRASEVKRLLPIMCRAYEDMKAEKPHLQAILPLSAYVAPLVQNLLGADSKIQLVKGDDASMAALVAADVGVICSGTATLEAGLANLRGLVVYRSDWLTTLIARFFVDKEKIVLANVVAGQDFYPLLLSGQVNARNVSQGILSALAADAPDIATSIREALHHPNHNFGAAVVAALRAH